MKIKGDVWEGSIKNLKSYHILVSVIIVFSKNQNHACHVSGPALGTGGLREIIILIFTFKDL